MKQESRCAHFISEGKHCRLFLLLLSFYLSFCCGYTVIILTMPMQSYVHNPQLFRRHFSGKSLEAFNGKRIQRGRGVAFSFLKRIAVPLLNSAAPHIVGAASSLARRLTAKAFPKHKRMQRIVGDVVRTGTGAAVTHVQKRATVKRGTKAGSASPRKKPKQNASRTSIKTARRTVAVAKPSKRGAIIGKKRNKRNIFNE